jgi:hypothetical protein
MSKMLHWLLMGAIAAGISVTPGGAVARAAADETPQAEQKKPTELLAEGDRLADEKKYSEALLQYKRAYESIVPQLRGLDFKEPVDPSLMKRAELQKRMVELVAEEIPEDRMVLMDRSLKVFGFIPAAMKVESTLLNLYTEEVAGFYHPKTKKIFLITEADEPKKQGLLGLLFGSSDPFNKDEQKVALSHEMAHALADQHFNLDRLQEATKDDEDMEMALAALIEGEATLVMMAEMGRESGGDVRGVLQTPPEVMESTMGLMRVFMPFATGKTFRSSPLIFRESLIFPYFQGMVFVLHLTNRGGWTPVDQAFRDPPASTEQILHPTKYRFPRDIPTAIDLPELQEAAGEGWKQLGGNVLGEFQITILLNGHNPKQAAAGWDGDRYVVFEDGEGNLGLCWLSTWDTAGDAKEFAAAYAGYLKEKIGVKQQEAKADDDADEQAEEQVDPKLRLTRDGRVYHVERRDSDVAVIEGFSEEATDRLAEKLFQAEKKPKHFRIPDEKEGEKKDAQKD